MLYILLISCDFLQIWRTGANQATTISFSDDVKINGQLVEKGEYHVYSVPGESKIDLVIYEKTSAWGSLKSFDEFLKVKFKNFGSYEDAILIDDNFLFHSALSSSLNLGLITHRGQKKLNIFF